VWEVAGEEPCISQRACGAEAVWNFFYLKLKDAMTCVRNCFAVVSCLWELTFVLMSSSVGRQT
jgi:hypothetical protein